MIKFSKLKEGQKILLETKESIFEIEVVTPSTGRVLIVGSRRFLTKTKARIVGAHDEDGKVSKLEIQQNKGVEIEYKDGETNNNFVTAPVLSAQVSGVDDKNQPWTFEVWSKPDISSAVSEARMRK